MEDSKRDVEGAVSGETVKVMAESIGITNANEEACKHLAEDVTFRRVTLNNLSWLCG